MLDARFWGGENTLPAGTYSTSSSAWTLLIPWTRAIPSLLRSISRHSIVNLYRKKLIVPDRQDTASLGEAGLFLDTSYAGLEDGGDFGGSSLRIAGIRPGGIVGSWGSSSDLRQDKNVSVGFVAAATIRIWNQLN
jgi:hypothetical protein